LGCNACRERSHGFVAGLVVWLHETGGPIDDVDLPREAFEATLEVGERFMMSSSGGTVRYAVGGFYALLLTEASACAARAAAAAKEGNVKSEVGAAASAVLAAAAACESYLSEFLARAEMFQVLDVDALNTVRMERDAQQQWKSLIKARGAEFDFETSTEYAQLGCLFQLRNHIAHRNSRLEVRDSWPYRLADCAGQRTIPVTNGPFYDWAVVAYRHQVAEWAYTRAAKWLDLADRAIQFTC
jgi:hypothetical protein